VLVFANVQISGTKKNKS